MSARLRKRSWTKATVAVVAATGVAFSGATGVGSAEQPSPESPPAGQHSYQPPSIQWGPCQDPELIDAGAECGSVEVPLDYADPGGKKIRLAVSRVKHKTPDAQSQGPMLVNPGGPGGSGLTYATFGEMVPHGVGDSYDWIGFDPRGVGKSQPALSCVPDHNGYNRPPYVPVTPEIERTWRDKSQRYARECVRNNDPAMLDNMKTTDVAKDVESIRKALGVDRINYYGFSYGTYIGQVYSTLFPGKFRRVVFDGVVNPTRVWYEANLDQDIAFDRNIKVYFDWLAKHDDVYHLGDTGAEVEKLFYSEQFKLSQNPAGGKIGSAEWTDIFLQAGYYVYGWEELAQAFAGWVHEREARPLIDLFGTPPFQDNGYAVYLATECTDASWPTDWNRWRIDNWTTHFRAPFETWANAWYNAPCASWKGERSTPVNVDGSANKGALLISETLDAATPYEGALEVRKRFPNSVLIEGVGGTTHSGSLSGVACTDDRIAQYLRDGTLPQRKPGNRSDVRCEPVPQPEPGQQQTLDSKPEREQFVPPLPR